MKNLKNSITIMTLFFLISLAFNAQNSITGSISNWTNGEVPLLFSDYISREKITMGNIASDGNMTIPLDEIFLSNLKTAAEKAKEKAPQGWEMKFNTIESTFGSGEEGISYENAASVLIGLPDLEAGSEDGTAQFGYVYCTSNPELANWLYNYGQGDIAIGYYLRWFFAEDTASVKGSVSIPVYTGRDDENYTDTTFYDIELQKGWNMIKYNVTKTYTTQTGKTVLAKMEVSKIDEIPLDVLWLVL
ncbi:hypothetical protein V8G69_13130 [Gaetbulibacter sp. M235]|uniref:hypothetical protein n=1 Tax=Gaetbulibacter sp. M235 TaxID=3126510 RepID=UPI00374F6324